MPDWKKSMQQTFEYYTVDPNSWEDEIKIDTIISSTITWDAELGTLGSAAIDTTSHLKEGYIRIYMITIQDDVTEKIPLGTFLVQTPSYSFDGKVYSTTIDAYTPLLELKENPPPLGYALLKNDNIMDRAYMITREHVRAPVIETESDKKLSNDFISNPNDTWLSFLTDLIANAEYKYDLDEMGHILFSKDKDVASLRPRWTYNDDNSSILYPAITVNHDLFGIPNVVEVIYSNGGEQFYARVVNSDSNSPVSTKARGRQITHRDTNPSFSGIPTQEMVTDYAKRLLKALSTVKYELTYTHGYCPIRVGDCVRLNYSRANLTDIKAKVISQTIKCVPGCPVTEKVIYTKSLWEG